MPKLLFLKRKKQIEEVGTAMNANETVISQPITCKLSCKNLNSDPIIS